MIDRRFGEQNRRSVAHRQQISLRVFAGTPPSGNSRAAAAPGYDEAIDSRFGINQRVALQDNLGRRATIAPLAALPAE